MIYKLFDTRFFCSNKGLLNTPKKIQHKGKNQIQGLFEVHKTCKCGAIYMVLKKRL